MGVLDRITIVQISNVSRANKNVTAERLIIVVPQLERDDMADLLRSAARQLLKENDKLDIYAYLEKEAIGWHGYIARVEHGKGEEPKVFFDNDPMLRHAIYLEFGD